MKTATANALAEIKTTEQDFEWYPTTNEIIDAFHEHANKLRPGSLLDIGAGDGKVLKRFAEKNKRDPEDHHSYHTELFAIEKARPLLDSLPVDIGILGTDLWEQSLLDKSVDCIFSNPPYSEFIAWSTKVIREANSNYIYLVIPQRWKGNDAINNAIKARQAKFEVIGSFDFMSAQERTARAKVDLVFIQLCHDYHRTNSRNRNDVTPQTDPFEIWIKDYFGMDGSDKKESEYEKEQNNLKSRKDRIKNSLVTGRGMIEVLDELYQSEMGELIGNYKKVCSLDAGLFKELDISLDSVIKSIKVKIKGMKHAYWNELFANYAPLTERLTAASRKIFIESINRKTNIDFTASNAYAITVWSIKNADQYLDNQMIDTWNKMVDSANVVNYKSNERVFKKDCWRYNHGDHSHFALDYRIVVARMGGLNTARYHDERGGLSLSAADFVDDLLVIAKNIGFNSDDSVRNHSFVAGSKEVFYCINKAGQNVVLMEVKAYMNGNLHIKFNQAFMLALNVEIGRLQGWIHSAQEAAKEMDAPVSKVNECFNTAFRLEVDSSIKLIS